ncbi:MAG TPA: GNAT family N-acetyltransferase [Mycobacteriales bacterium]
MTAAPWTRAGHEALGRPDLQQVREIERLAARAWPALERQSLGGWVLRAAGGVSRRTNSAWPRSASTLTVGQLLRATTAWYGARGLPPIIALSPASEPRNLADRLGAGEAGWGVDGETLVLAGPAAGRAHEEVTVSPVPDEDWWSVAGQVTPAHFDGPRRPVAQAILQAISRQCGYAVARDGGGPVAVGRAVVDGSSVGVFSMGTVPDRRGEGHGRKVLESLCAWGIQAGADTAWLQVEVGNAPARRLYDGLEPVFTYAYATRLGQLPPTAPS